MPKRTNLFQQLALAIHKALEPEWEVNESVMLKDSVTHQPREVDIVARQFAAGYQIVLSVECCDHNRTADVQWVELQSKKHEHLPTSKLVLWSRSGFTKPALSKAKALKIDTVSQAQALVPIWAQMARELVGRHVQYVAPSFKPFVDAFSSDGTLSRHTDVGDWKFFDHAGRLVGSVSALFDQLNSNEQARDALLDHAPPGRGDFHAVLNPPETWFTDLPDGSRCKIRRIGVGIGTIAAEAPLETASAAIENKVTTIAIAKFDHGTLEILVEESEDGTTSSRSRVVPKEVPRKR
jgi:hypothetical protein